MMILGASLVTAAALTIGRKESPLVYTGFALFLAGLFIFGVYQEHGLFRAERIERGEIYLSGICQEFLDSVEDHRRSA